MNEYFSKDCSEFPEVVLLVTLSLLKSLYKMVQQKQLVFLFLASLATQALSFSVASRSAPFLPSSRAPEIVQRSTALRGLFAPEEGEQKTLTRDSEPDVSAAAAFFRELAEPSANSRSPRSFSPPRWMKCLIQKNSPLPSLASQAFPFHSYLASLPFTLPSSIDLIVM